MTVRFLGVDLAWGEGSDKRPANRSGVVALERDGTIRDAGWTIGLPDTLEWIEQVAGTEDALLFVDAPLVIANETGQRLCERNVGQRYGSSWVSANSTNRSSARQAGVALRAGLEARGWRYDDGVAGPGKGTRVVSECYPYTTIVGAEELGYDQRRPPYKRPSRGLTATDAWAIRTAACDELIKRIAGLVNSDPPLDLRSHPQTRKLVEIPSPSQAAAYKQREDLLDACLCAWAASLWHRHGLERCQVLGEEDSLRDHGGRLATIIAPARDGQRPS